MGHRLRSLLTSNTCTHAHTHNAQPFELRENDYVFGQLKFGGNAQSAWFHRLIDLVYNAV